VKRLLVEGYPVWYKPVGIGRPHAWRRGPLLLMYRKGHWLFSVDAQGYSPSQTLGRFRTLEEAVHFALLYEWDRGITVEPRRGNPKLVTVA
jgi:hypothetical protein